MGKFLDGIKLGLGFIFIISLIFGIVFAVGFHSANEITSGIFTGDYEFQGALKLNNAALGCNVSRVGSLKYNNSIVQVCNGTDWNDLSTSNLVTVLGIDGYTKLMLHFNNDWSDSSSSGHTITPNGGATFTSGHFSEASSFDGTDDYLTVSDSTDWDFGTGDWTIDAWIYITGSDVYEMIWNTGGENAVDGIFFGLNNGDYYFQSHSTHIFTHSQDLRNGWHHIAASRSGDTTYHFIDGSLVGTLNVAGINMDNSYIPKIANGYGGATSLYTQGYIDELRISKGIARWTANFTVPAGPYS